jgi:uncharacterized membrane protein HdeD (DUF308 family)
MTTSASAAADPTHTMIQDVADHWGLVVLVGVLSIALGLLAILFPGATLLTVGIYFAPWLVVSGPRILSGIIVLTYPMTSAVTLAFVGGIWLVILGATQVYAGLQLRSLRRTLGT